MPLHFGSRHKLYSCLTGHASTAANIGKKIKSVCEYNQPSNLGRGSCWGAIRFETNPRLLLLGQVIGRITALS